MVLQWGLSLAAEDIAGPFAVKTKLNCFNGASALRLRISIRRTEDGGERAGFNGASALRLRISTTTRRA